MKEKNSMFASRRGFLKGAAALGLGAAGGLGCGGEKGGEAAGGKRREEPSAAPAGRGGPNIVYIFADQFRGDCLGAVGHPVIKTPRLDALAGRGVTFGRCYSNAPLCRPGRASMMTGLYPREHGVWHNFAVPDQGTATHVRRMRDEVGYHTAVIGKTHLHEGIGDIDQYRCILGNFGFESIHELTGPGQSAKIRTSYNDFLKKQTAKGQRSKYRRYKSYVHAYAGPFRERPWDLPPPDSAPWDLETEDHLDLYTAELAAGWLKEQGLKRPFYLQVCLPGPHDPFDAPSAYRALYDPADPRMPKGVVEAPSTPLNGLVRQSIKFQNITGLSPEQKALLQVSYFGKISVIDEAVGRILDALDEAGLSENTWVVFGSDHGEMLGDHQLLNKTVFFEQSVHIPCIIRPPGGVEGWRCDGLTDQLDVTATIGAIAGLDEVAGHGEPLLEKIERGASAEDAQKHKDHVVAENHGFGMVRDERYKLVIHYKKRKPVELFDLEADPKELNNRVDDSALTGVRKELEERYWSVAVASS